MAPETPPIEAPHVCPIFTASGLLVAATPPAIPTGTAIIPPTAKPVAAAAATTGKLEVPTAVVTAETTIN